MTSAKNAIEPTPDSDVGATRTTFPYFAYGSNMLTRRLAAPNRAPSAVRTSIGYVEGRRLVFDKVSQDGSGKCDAQATQYETDRVYGVIFEIGNSDRARLDAAEGLEKGYKDQTVEVITPAGTISARTYIAMKKDSALRPYHWYKALTIAGAVEHGLPMAYVEWLRTFDSIEDPKSDRRAENEALLFEQPGT